MAEEMKRFLNQTFNFKINSLKSEESPISGTNLTAVLPASFFFTDSPILTV